MHATNPYLLAQLARLANNDLEQAPMELLELPKLRWVALGGNPFLPPVPPIASSIPVLADDTKPIAANSEHPGAGAGVLGTGSGGAVKIHHPSDRVEPVALKS